MLTKFCQNVSDAFESWRMYNSWSNANVANVCQKLTNSAKFIIKWWTVGQNVCHFLSRQIGTVHKEYYFKRLEKEYWLDYWFTAQVQQMRASAAAKADVAKKLLADSAAHARAAIASANLGAEQEVRCLHTPSSSTIFHFALIFPLSVTYYSSNHYRNFVKIKFNKLSSNPCEQRQIWQIKSQFFAKCSRRSTSMFHKKLLNSRF